MNKRYVCPKCRCGCLFEEKGKLICLNCDAEVRKAAAQGVRHEHHHQTYSLRTSDRPVTVAKTSAPKPAPSVVNRRDTAFPTLSGASGQILKPDGRRHRTVVKNGCGLWFLLFIALFWLLPALIGLLSFAF